MLMNKDDALQHLSQSYNIVSTIDFQCWKDDYAISQEWLRDICKKSWRESYDNNDRILVIHEQDIYVDNSNLGLLLRNLQIALNEIDITSSFVLVLSTNPKIDDEITELHDYNVDQANKIQHLPINGAWKSTHLDRHPTLRAEIYQYGSVNPIKIRLGDLDDRKRFLLAESKTFCMYPWIHLHTHPTGQAWPCCHAESTSGSIGSVKQNTLKELWNSDRMRQLRQDMLSGRPNDYCVRCYEQEQAGFFGGRQSANKHHGHNIHRIDQTQADGSLPSFEMTYWDIRFSNLCNLRCRSCGHIFSSQWYQDQAALAGPEWAKNNKVLKFAGRTEIDMWEQLVPHFDYVEQVYFAGGEPLMMDEHYRILEELERRGRFDVRLIYNTNFTQVKLKNRYVFDYWRRFESVAVGASLDAMGPRAEYIRKGTDWSTVEANRRKMLEICPEVDFYISPTLSIMNALHLPDFHRDWVEQGLLKPQDLNVNVLQDPVHYRVDIAPVELKRQIRKKIQDHLDWLRPLDQLNRATQGFESVLNFMDATDNSQLIPMFWQKTQQLDEIREEKLLDIIPELAILR